MSSMTSLKSCSTKCGSMKRSCSSVPQRTRRAARRAVPEAGHQAAQQQLLGQRHARVRRHLEGAQLEQAEAAGRAVRRIQLVDAELGAVGVAGDVDQQVAQHAVDQPGRHVAAGRNLAEGVSISYSESLRASSMRGAWLVGPMNRPENR
jgi:hypothetical protein